MKLVIDPQGNAHQSSPGWLQAAQAEPGIFRVVDVPDKEYQDVSAMTGGQLVYRNGKLQRQAPPEPTAAEKRAAALAKIEAEYQPQIEAIDKRYLAALAQRLPQVALDGIAAQRKTLQDTYNAKRGAV